MTVLVYAEAPVVENVRFEQRTDGTLLVDIYYDVTDAEGDTLEIKIKASADDGSTWNLPCVSLSGDTGKVVIPGTNKHIVWDFYADNPGVRGDGYRIRVIADENDITTVTDIDGNVYKTVKIGDQWWMAENLKVRHYRNGDPIPHEINNVEWIMLTTGAYCYYDNDSSHAADYGALYNWYTVSDFRNIAPEGWHVPTDEEWKELEMALGISQEYADSTEWRGTNEGGKLKETGTTHWNSPNEGATNESGFTARAGTATPMVISAIWAAPPLFGLLQSTLMTPPGTAYWPTLAQVSTVAAAQSITGFQSVV